MTKYPIEEGSLKNDVVAGKIVGYQFGVRLPRYRGNMLSLVNGYYVNVDGEEIAQDAMTFEINGKKPRTWAEIKEAVWEHWDYQTTGYIHIAKEGGLAIGEHKIKAVISNFEQYGFYEHDQERVDYYLRPTETPLGFSPEAETQILVLKEA